MAKIMDEFLAFFPDLSKDRPFVEINIESNKGEIVM